MKPARVTPTLPRPELFRRWGIADGWSQLVEVPSHDGSIHRWHVLERTPAEPIATIVCVHGNPTWSYLWRSFLQQLGDRYRVIAVDQLGMGYSARTERRTYADRVRDVDDVLTAMGVTGPIYLAAHDWGGAVAMGWAVAHPNRVKGLILTNTGIALPRGTKGPALIRLAAASGFTDLACRRTALFVAGTGWLSGRKMTKTARQAYLAPYRSAAERTAIAEFVADVPFGPSHSSYADVAAVAEALPTLDVPVLLAWGGNDPVFSDAFADDVAGRFTMVDRHRFAHAGHLVVEEADVASVADAWLTNQAAHPTVVNADLTTRANVKPSAHPAPADRRSLWAALDDRADDDGLAFHNGATDTAISWSALHDGVHRIAAGLRATGVQPGDRVALLTPPGPELLQLLYGCWRAGAVTVLADRGLGLRGLRAAVRGAGPQWYIGPSNALAVARSLRWAPGARAIQTDNRRVPSLATTSLSALLNHPADTEVLAPDADAVAAILFTSGATGPAKGVRYVHHQLEAQRDALARTYAITADDALVAAFAPFALYGPALGIRSAIPDVDVTQPGALTAAAFDRACAAIDATISFASPAALANVVATASGAGPAPALGALRLVLSAGAPVPAARLQAMRRLCPLAEMHTPYGMTEALPITDIELNDLTIGVGVPVGHPVAGAAVRIAPLNDTMGRILVSAPWLSDGYDRLWLTENRARTVIDGVVWHDSGDVGHIDGTGALWVEGRYVHLISTTDGWRTPVPLEMAAEHVPGVVRAAAVGVGPSGVQQVVIVVEGSVDGLAHPHLAAEVRAAVGGPVAAVLSLRDFPVDIRHNAKIDRSALARWATAVLNGRHAKPPT